MPEHYGPRRRSPPDWPLKTPTNDHNDGPLSSDSQLRKHSTAHSPIRLSVPPLAPEKQFPMNYHQNEVYWVWFSL